MTSASFSMRAFLSAFAALALALACVNAAPTPQQVEQARYERPKGWANDRGDLPRDPDYALGTMPNGMRYLILPNGDPPGQVAMRMVIAAGSMHERPGEEGIAHFLEHLAFRGTTNIPDGELQRRLENLGLQMGSDVNATTAADRTTFMLNLARNDEGSLDTGLMILREIVSEIALAPDLVNAERGVVLAEERARAGPELEAAIQSIRLQVGDHPYGRAPIGKREVIQAVTPEQIRVFYNAYYRPERATLIVVGDITPDRIETAIRERFQDWAGKGEAGGDPQPVMKKPPSPDVAMLVTEGSSDIGLQLRWFEPYFDAPRTLAERRRFLVESLGTDAISRRMQGLLEAAGRPARSVGSPRPGLISGVWRGETASASGVMDVGATINLMVTSHRQAITHGVTQEELDRSKSLRLDAMRQAAMRGRTGSTESLADLTVAQVSGDAAFTSLKQDLAILEAQLPTITLAEVNAELRARFTDRPTLIYRGPRAPEGGEAALRAAFAKASAAPVTAYAAEAVKPWPYSDFGAPGKVAERREVDDLGITMVRFGNGVRLSVKKFTAQKDQVNVQVRLGLGRLGMPRDRIDASDMGALLWSSGGLNKLTRTEQSRTLAGKRVLAVARTDDDAYVIENAGIATPADFGLQLQLMAAMVADPAYRTDDWASLMADADRSDAATPYSAGGVLRYNLPRLLHSGDLRWTFNNAEMRSGWKPEDAVAYIRPIVASSPIEVIVVGDIDIDLVISDTARTFGALPPREDKPEPPGLRDVSFPKPGAEPVVVTHKGRADQGYALVAWPTQGLFEDVRGHRVGWVLGQMLRDQATRELRSGSGATYSPDSDVEFSRELPGYGYISVMVEVAPELIDGVLAQMQDIATRLGTGDMPASEVRRIVAPRVEQSRRDRAGSAGYWIQHMAGAQTDPRGLDLIRTQVSDYESISPADIQAAARRWLRSDTAWRLKVVPEAKGS